MNAINYTRRYFLKTVGLGAAALTMPRCIRADLNTVTADSKANRRMNVLFIAADDLRFELGCYGNTDVITPNIDALAKRGLLFDRAYCQQAVCNPSRASVLTGRRPDTTRVWDNKTHFRKALPDVVTLPQHFKQCGYYTQNIGKIFHNTGGMDDPVSWSVPAQHHAGAHWKDWVLPDNQKEPPVRKMEATQCVDVPDNAYWDGQIADEAIKTLRQIKGRSFFLAVGFWKPHLPFNAPKKYWDLYARSELAPPVNPNPPRDVPQIALHNWRELRGYEGIPKEGPLSPEKIMELRHGYYACISYLDTQLGRLMTELERLKLANNTIVVFWADHGFHLGEHNLWGKTTNFELDSRVPLILATPRPKHADAKTDALVELVDIYPTLVELCGLPMPGALEGTSMVPLLDDPKQPWKKAAFTQHPRPFYSRTKPKTMGYSIRTDRYRYTEWRDIESGKVVVREMYNHHSDPGETVNLADQPIYADVLEHLLRALQAGPAKQTSGN